MIETRILQQFIAVAESLSFRKAAERLHMSQPPLSLAVKRLEEEIGVVLLERNNRMVRLTDAGKAFLAHAYATLNTLESGIACTRRVAQGHEGHIRISFISLLTYPFLMDAFRIFRDSYPDVSCDMREATTREQIEALDNGNVDVCFIRDPGAVAPKLSLELVLREKFQAVLPATHRLAPEKRIDLSLLKDEPFVASTRSLGQVFHDKAVELCQTAGFSPNIVHLTERMPTVIGLVASGFGVALVPEGFAAQAPAGVVFRPLIPETDTKLLNIDLYMAHDKNIRSLIKNQFLEIVRSSLRPTAVSSRH